VYISHRQELRQAFVDSILALRRERNMTQEQLARAAGINRVYMGGLERGQHTPTIEMLYRIANALELSAPDLMKDIDTRRFVLVDTGALIQSREA
jgi:XRE family transcriptional regulator, regulator of sulfur utilization